MSRRAKGPRLWFRADRQAWFILDNGRQYGTRLGAGASEQERETALREYLAEKHTAAATSGTRDPAQIPIDDVLALYVRDKLPALARPIEAVTQVQHLRKFWGGKPLSYVTGPTCREYAKARSTRNMARHELELFRAAINHHRQEGLHDKIVTVVLPARPPARERWLTRSEAAHLIITAWRYREKQNARATDRATRKHVARFMLVARYMGSRAAVICSASIEPKRPAGKAWVDLNTGIFYGRPEGHRETKKRRQMVPVPPRLLAHLRRWRRRGQRYVVEWNGRPVASIAKAHRAAVASAGLGPKVTPHVWRHTVATWTAQKGVNPKQAAAFLAMSLETYMRVYGHHDPSRFGDVHAAL